MANVYEEFTGLEERILCIVDEYANFYTKNGHHLADVMEDFEPEDQARTIATMPESVKIRALEEWSPKLARAYLATLEPLPKAALLDQLSLKAQRGIIGASIDSQDEQVQLQKDETEFLSGSGAQEKRDDDNDGGKNEEEEDSSSSGSGSEDGDKYNGSEYVGSGDEGSEDSEDEGSEDSEDECSEDECSEDSEHEGSEDGGSEDEGPTVAI
jgi:hypothetical protein